MGVFTSNRGTIIEATRIYKQNPQNRNSKNLIGRIQIKIYITMSSRRSPKSRQEQSSVKGRSQKQQVSDSRTVDRPPPQEPVPLLQLHVELQWKEQECDPSLSWSIKSGVVHFWKILRAASVSLLSFLTSRLMGLTLKCPLMSAGQQAFYAH